MSDIFSDETVAELLDGRQIFTIRCDNGDIWDEWDANNICSFPDGEDNDTQAWNTFANKIETGDLLVARTAGNPPKFWGIGVVADPYTPDHPTVVSDDQLSENLSADQMEVNWVTIASNGEILRSNPPEEYYPGAITQADESFFKQLVAGIDEESFPPAAEQLLDRIRIVDQLPDITATIDQHLPPQWRSSESRKRQIEAVVTEFLRTNSTNDTSWRRRTAQRKVAEAEDVEINTIQSKCGRETWDENPDGGYHAALFEPALEDIEQSLKQNGSQTMDSQHSNTVETAYFILKTGSEQSDDNPVEKYFFKNGDNGTKQLREAEHNAKFVFLADNEFYARGEIGDVELETIDEAEQDSVAQVEQYEEIESTDLDAVWSQLSPQLPIDEDIIEIEQEDYELLTNERSQMEAIEQLLKAESRQADLYREALAHLVAGKNILFYGPPGTGKTRAAELLADAVCQDVDLVTANAEWSNHQVVGGYKPNDGGWEPSPGFLTEAAQNCHSSLNETGDPSWLIIDELNRANLDEAFGEVFTLLDIDYRDAVPIDYGGEDVTVPLSFRILGTMNTYDQAQLFSLGYAFRRRFAFVKVPSLLKQEAETESVQTGGLSGRNLQLTQESSYVVELVKREIPKFFSTTSNAGATAADVAPIIQEFASSETAQAALAELTASDDLSAEGLDFIETLTYIAQEVTKKEVIDIGQALLIDAAKFVVAHWLLFPEETTRETLDRAVVAYLVPQFEQYMSELRRAETVNRDSDAKERYGEVIQLTEDLALPETAAVLKQAGETKQILES